MNVKPLASLISSLLLAVSATAVADENKIDEVVSFASKSDIETVSFASDAVGVSDAMVSVNVAAVAISSPVKPTLAAPMLVKVVTIAAKAPEAVASNN